MGKEGWRECLMKNFPQKNWSAGGFDFLLRKIDQTNDVARKEGSGREKSFGSRILASTQPGSESIRSLCLVVHASRKNARKNQNLPDISKLK